MKNRFLPSFIFIATLFVVPCSLFAETPLSGRLVLTGSSTVAPLAAEMGRYFEKIHPDVQIDVQTGGSSRGVADVRRHLADIGMVSRALKNKENDLTAHTIAFDGITLITHRDNPIEALSNQEVIQIYKGKIKTWKTLNGHERPVTVVNKAKDRSTLELFLSYFMIKNRDIKAHIIIGDNAQGIKTVAGNPDAIAYVSIGAAEYDASQGVPIKLLPVSGHTPSIKNVQKGRFPIIRPLNLVTNSTHEGLAKAFIRFTQSPEVHPIVKEQFFVPISE